MFSGNKFIFVICNYVIWETTLNFTYPNSGWQGLVKVNCNYMVAVFLETINFNWSFLQSITEIGCKIQTKKQLDKV